VSYFLNTNLHNQDLVIDTPVKIKAIPMVSSIDGYKSKSGKIVNCMMMARMKPLPTSMKLSIRLLIRLKAFISELFWTHIF
jgi:hypothetical protein